MPPDNNWLKQLLALLAVVSLSLAACGGTPTPEVETTTQAPVPATQSPPIETRMGMVKPTDTPLPTDTATYTPNPTDTSTYTLTLTDTPTDTLTPTGTPTDTPEPTTTPTNTPGPTAAPESQVTLRLVAELETAADTLAFSPDDKLLALGNSKNEVQVWDTASWSQRWTAAHDDHLRKVAFSPDGQRLASVSFDNTARLWDVASGDQVAQLDYGYWVYGLDFSSDGQRWATGSFDGKVIISNATTGQPISEFKHELMVIDLALSPNGPWLAVMTTGSWGPGKVVVWDIFTHEQRILAEFDGPAYSNVTFSPDTQWLAAALGNGPITVWQTQIWTEAAQLVTPMGQTIPVMGIVKQLAFSPDGLWLAGVVSYSEAENKVMVWEVPTWRVVSQMEQADVVWDIAFSPDGQWLVTGLGQGIEHPPAYEGQLWETTSGRLVAHMPHAQQVLAVAFSHDGKRIATGSIDQTVKIWEPQSTQ